MDETIDNDAIVKAVMTSDIPFLTMHLCHANSTHSEDREEDEFAFLEEQPTGEDQGPNRPYDERGYNLLDLICERLVQARRDGQPPPDLTAVTLFLILEKGAESGDATLEMLYTTEQREGLGRYGRQVHRFRRTIGLFSLAAFGFDPLGQKHVYASQGWATRRLYGMAAVVHGDLSSSNIAGTCQLLHPAFLDLLAHKEASPVRDFCRRMAANHTMMESIRDNHAHRFMSTVLKTPGFERAILHHARWGRSGEDERPLLDRFVKRTILLAEDQDQTRARLVSWLISKGFKVLEARNGLEAIQLYKSHHAEVELVLTDFGMPEMDGLSLTSAIREWDQELPVVIQTTPPIHPDIRLHANQLNARLIAKHNDSLLWQTLKEAQDIT